MNTSSNKSTKGFTLVEIMIVVVIIGLLAAMAIPAFQKVRATSQDKVVFSNLRRLYGAAQTYYLEYGVSTVTSTTLVGTDTSQYVKTFQTVVGETYTATLVDGSDVTAMGVAGQRTVTFGP